MKEILKGEFLTISEDLENLYVHEGNILLARFPYTDKPNELGYPGKSEAETYCGIFYQKIHEKLDHKKWLFEVSKKMIGNR